MRNISWVMALMGILVVSNRGHAFEPMAAVAKPPKYLQLLKHYPSESALNLNPGYYKNQKLAPQPALQQCLLTELTKAGVSKKWPNKVGLALVDLTGDKLNDPEIATYHANTTMYGASQAKTAALLGAHQLLYDLKHVAAGLAKKGQTSLAALVAQVTKDYGLGKDLKHLQQMFDLKESPNGVAIAFKASFKDALDQMIRISNNAKATQVIKQVGFNYIHSVLWQTGIYDQAQGGGLWVGRTFAGGSLWHRDPVAHQSHATNAITMAKYMTLVAQRRLVSPELSASIEDYLKNTIWPIKFVQGFKEMGLKVNEEGAQVKDSTRKVTIFRKSGSMTGNIHNVSHDAAIIHREVCVDKSCATTKHLRYVATAASKDAATSQMANFIKYMDRCVRLNNKVAI